MAPAEVVSGCSWCNKCTKYYGKVLALSGRHHYDVIGGLYQKRIILKCRKSSHIFKISYAKKLEQIVCLKCRHDDKQQEKEQLRREEAVKSNELKIAQEKMYAEAKLLMEKELL